MLMVVSKIVNTDCIYYNYDAVTTVDNLTGSNEEIRGVVKEKRDDGDIVLGYTLDDSFTTGIIKNADKIKISGVNEIEVGDFVNGTGKVVGKDNEVKTYEITNTLKVQEKEKYEQNLKNELLGKKEYNTAIVDYVQSESGYDGYVICDIYFSPESRGSDGYIKVFYDFYENKTESFLGNKDNPVERNYGIANHEMVTITFTEPVSDLNKINAKTFEFIAD